MELNFESLEMQKSQRSDKKDGVISQAVTSTPRVMKVKCQEWLIFVFLADDSNKSVTVWAIHLSASERSYLALSENATGLWVTISKTSSLGNTGSWYVLLIQQFFIIFTLSISQTVTPKPINHTIL